MVGVVYLSKQENEGPQNGTSHQSYLINNAFLTKLPIVEFCINKNIFTIYKIFQAKGEFFKNS